MNISFQQDACWQISQANLYNTNLLDEYVAVLRTVGDTDVITLEPEHTISLLHYGRRKGKEEKEDEEDEKNDL